MAIPKKREPTAAPESKKRPRPQDAENVVGADSMARGQAVKPQVEKRGRAGQKRKTPGINEIKSALLEAIELPQSVREMLIAGIPECFAADTPQQQKFVSFITEALFSVEGRLSRKVSEAEEAAAALGQSAVAAARSHETISTELAACSEALRAQELSFASAENAVKEAKEVLTSANVALSKLDSEIGAAAMKAAMLQQRLKATSLASAAEAELEAGFLEHDQQVRDLAITRISACAAVADAQSACDVAEAEPERDRCLVDAAITARKECASRLKAAWNATRGIQEEQGRADAAAVECRTQLVNFQAGPLAAVKALSSQVFEAPKRTAMKASSHPVTEVRRLSFVEIRRRRSSFLPPKAVAKRVAAEDTMVQATEVNAPSNNLAADLAALPTPARGLDVD